MLSNSQRPFVACLLTFLLVQSACGSSSYLIDGTYLTQPNPQGVPARAENTGESVFVSPRKMHLDRPAPLPAEFPDARWRVKPRRPTGLVVAGAVTLGIGTILTVAGVAQIPCPQDAFCENGVAVGAILGLGSVHMLIGGIQLIAAAAKWSPEVSAPRAW